MATITQIEIDGFKAFPENFVLDLEDGKNILLYGENGSGKSSIYYALHAVFQSVLKDDRGAKYFKPEDEQHLININKIEDVENNDYQPFIRITFDNGDIWRLDRDGLTSENGGLDDMIKLLNRGSAFINHSYISRFHTARNSEDINLWNVFHKDILPFYRADEKSNFLSVIFDNIEHDAERFPRMSNKTFLGKIADFNNKLAHFIEDINKRINDIYNNHFKFDDDNKLYIKLLYYSDDDKENTNKEPYHLFYGKNRFGQGRPVSLDIPRIGISIKENGTEIYKPQTYFNEARLTAIALAVRFACLSKKSEGCFLALDDMLISLDMGNRRKVIDFLFDVASQYYKIYLFTHDRLFYSSIRKRISIDHVQDKWMSGSIYMHNIDEKNNYKSCLPYPIYIEDKDTSLEIYEYYAMHDYPACGQKLRKWCEKILDRLYPDTLKKQTDSTTGRTMDTNLNDRILKLEEFCTKEKIEYSQYKNLKIYKDCILNVVSHYDIQSPIYGNEILEIARILDSLDSVLNSICEIKVNHELGIELLKPNKERLTVCIDVLSNKIKVYDHKGEQNITYYHKCKVKKIIENGNATVLAEPLVFNSIYEAYDKYYTDYHIEKRENLLDLIFDHGVKLRDKL